MKASSIDDARSLGVKLRRAILTDISGLAATAVRIEGVSHEFQALPGAREDVLDLILNLKSVRLAYSKDKVTAPLKSQGPQVTAGELNSSGARVANPDLVLANLSAGASLKMEVVFERGTGVRETTQVPDGFLPIDACFCPVTRVAVKPSADSLDITVETDGSLTPAVALSEAMQLVGDTRDYENLPLAEPAPAPEVRVPPEFNRDPFAGTAPPHLLQVTTESYKWFLDAGIPKLLETLFPLKSQADSSEGSPANRLDLLDHKLKMPSQSPDQCRTAGETYAARLIVRVRLSRNIGEPEFSYRKPVVTEQEVDMGAIPLMTDDGSFIIRGAHKTCILPIDRDLKVQRVGDLVYRELADLVSRMKPVLAERMAVGGSDSLRPTDVLKLIPFTAVANDLFLSAPWCQYTDETNPLAAVTHARRVSFKGIPDDAVEDIRQISCKQYGRLGYLETPEGPNIGLIQSLCNYTKVGEHGELLVPYKKVSKGKISAKIEYLSPEQEASLTIADASEVGADGKFVADRVIVREGDDIRRVPVDEVDYVSVSTIQGISASASLTPFLGSDDPNRALMGANMQRQAVPLVKTEQPLVKSGSEARVARESGLMVLAKRRGTVVEATGERIVVLAGKGKDVYELDKFRRTNQACCANQKPIVSAGQEVTEGQPLADTASTYGGELALGRNVLVAYMPFRGYTLEDAICISDELVGAEAFTSVHLHQFETNTSDQEAWAVPVGARVNPGDVLVQESSGRRRTLLTASLRNPGVVVACMRSEGRIGVVIAEKRGVKIGDKFSARHGNKGVVAKVLPRSEMPHMEDGTPVQMVLNTMGVISRLNMGQILETHCGALANALGTSLTIPPFQNPPLELLKKTLAQAGLGETGMFTLYDGSTGRPFESPVTVGYLYMLKLNHMVDDKIHAVATGVPSLLTGQPTAPLRANMLGFLEMWALQAYNASATLQESLTIKCDDAEGREKAALALLAGETVEPAGEGQSLKLLERALMGLGISVEEERI